MDAYISNQRNQRKELANGTFLDFQHGSFIAPLPQREHGSQLFPLLLNTILRVFSPLDVIVHFQSHLFPDSSFLVLRLCLLYVILAMFRVSISAHFSQSDAQRLEIFPHLSR